MSFQSAIPWRVALRQSLPPLHRLATILNNPLCRTMIFQRTATTPLTSCLSPRVHSNSPSPARLCRSSGRQGYPAAVIATQAMRSVGETQGSIQVLVHHHLATRQRGPPAHPLDLQAQILKAHGVVAVHAAFELQ